MVYCVSGVCRYEKGARVQVVCRCVSGVCVVCVGMCALCCVGALCRGRLGMVASLFKYSVPEILLLRTG